MHIDDVVLVHCDNMLKNPSIMGESSISTSNTTSFEIIFCKGQVILKHLSANDMATDPFNYQAFGKRPISKAC